MWGQLIWAINRREEAWSLPKSGGWQAELPFFGGFARSGTRFCGGIDDLSLVRGLHI